MSDKIPTAKEFLNQEKFYAVTSGDIDEIVNAMIEFTKLHRPAILEAALDNAQVAEHLGNDSEDWIVKESILNAYPEDLIK